MSSQSILRSAIAIPVFANLVIITHLAVASLYSSLFGFDYWAWDGPAVSILTWALPDWVNNALRFVMKLLFSGLVVIVAGTLSYMLAGSIAGRSATQAPESRE